MASRSSKTDKMSKAEREHVKFSMMALGYLYERSETGSLRRKSSFYPRILFIILLIVAFYYFGYIISAVTASSAAALSWSTIISGAVLGFIVGAVVGLTSVGAGALMTPILLLDFVGVVGKTLVVGTATTSGTVEKFIASARNLYKKRLKSGYLFIIALTGVPLASIGAFYSTAIISWNLFSPLLAAVLIVVALVIVMQNKLEKVIYDEPEITTGLRIKGLILGVIVGLIAGLTGVGTGSIMVAALILVLKFPNRTAVDIALVEGGLILLAATVTQLYLGHVNLPFTAILLAGGIPGILIGNHYKYRINQKLLGYGIAGVIILESARTLSQFFFGKSFFIF